MFLKRSLLNTFVFFVFLNPFILEYAWSKPSKRCEDNIEYNTNTNIFLFDKTTNLGETEKKNWKDITSKLFDNASISGRVFIAEIKDSSVSSFSSAPYCIPPATNHTQPQLTELVPGFEFNWTWIYNNIFSWIWLSSKKIFDDLASIFSSNPYPESDPDDKRSTQELVTAREKVRVGLADLVASDNPSPTTDILDPLFTITSVYCADQIICRLYIFSDFIDTKILSKLNNETEAHAIALANSDFDALIHEHPLATKDTSLSVIAWGIGRDQVESGKPLPPITRATLRRYWLTIFHRFCMSASPNGSKISLTEIFPWNGGRGC